MSVMILRSQSRGGYVRVIGVKQSGNHNTPMCFSSRRAVTWPT